MEQFISLEQASQILNVSVEETRRQIASGQITYDPALGIQAESLSEYLRDKTKQPKRLARRAFLRGSMALVVPGFVGAVAANFTGSLSAILAYDKLKLSRSTELEPLSPAGDLTNLIFGDGRNASWSTSVDHLMNTYGLQDFERSSTFKAAQSLFSNLEVEQSSSVSTALPGPIFLDGNIICIGGPVSDPVSRLCFETHGDRYSQVRTDNPTLDLPFLYEPSFQCGTGKRFVGGEVKEVKNWSLSIDGERLPPPDVDSRGYYISDYLMVTKVPNFLNRDAFVQGKSIVVIGGIHGTGTEAIKLLINDQSQLIRILNSCQGADFFQSLFLVSGIDHVGSQNNGESYPISLAHVETRPVLTDRELILRKWSGVHEG